MHRRKHKTLELRERANERASERSKSTLISIPPRRVPDLLLFSPETIRRHGDDVLAVNRGPSPFSLPETSRKARKPPPALRAHHWRGATSLFALVQSKATDLRIYPCWRAVRTTSGAGPFSLAAYIILPIERHTSFPLYVSIYNGPRNICSSLRAKE